MANIDAWMTQYETSYLLYETFARKLRAQIEEFLDHEGITSSSKGRAKDSESLRGKLKRKGDRYTKLEDVTDLTGVRIIVPTLDDVERVADIIRQEYFVDPDNSLDKARTLDPDRFGYLSQHYVVRVGDDRVRLREWLAYAGLWAEIQVRTELQHTWSSIQHQLDYKSAIDVPSALRRRLYRISALFELADQELNSIVSDGRDIVEQYAEIIEGKALEVEVNTESIMIFCRTSKNLEKLHESVFDSEYVDRICDETEREIFSASAVNAVINGYSTIGELEKLVDDALDWAPGFLNVVLPAFGAPAKNQAETFSQTRPLQITPPILLNYLTWGGRARNDKSIEFSQSNPFRDDESDDRLRALVISALRTGF